MDKYLLLTIFMGNYYIKTIWAPGGQDGLDDINRTEFAEGQERVAQRFIKCDGFFLYETGHKNKGKIGAKAIFAQGIIQTSPKVINTRNEHKYKTEGGEEKNFPYHVKINLSKIINSLNEKGPKYMYWTLPTGILKSSSLSENSSNDPAPMTCNSGICSLK